MCVFLADRVVVSALRADRTFHFYLLSSFHRCGGSGIITAASLTSKWCLFIITCCMLLAAREGGLATFGARPLRARLTLGTPWSVRRVPIRPLGLPPRAPLSSYVSFSACSCITLIFRQEGFPVSIKGPLPSGSYIRVQPGSGQAAYAERAVRYHGLDHAETQQHDIFRKNATFLLASV